MKIKNLDKKGIAWKYLIGILIALFLLAVLIFMIGKTRGGISGLIRDLASFF